MKAKRKEYRKPYGRGDYELRQGSEGVYWRAGHGLVVRLASPEDEETQSRNTAAEPCGHAGTALFAR